MWPELLKKIRSGLVFNPLNELEKRATQYGEGVGLGLEKSRAQTDYAKAHPKSQRAQQEAITNTMMMALSMWKPIKGVSPEHLAKINKKLPESIIAPAMGNKKAKLYNTGTAHYDAVPNLIRALKGGDADVHGWLTSRGRIVSDEVAYQIKEKELSAPVKAQAATRAQQRGGAARLTSEDVKGKLTPNRGTRADEPIIVPATRTRAQQRASAIARRDRIWNALGSVPGEKIGVEAPSISSKLAPNQGKVGGFIQPANPVDAAKLAIRNQVSAEIEEATPSVPGLKLIETLSSMMKRKPKRGGAPDPNEPTMMYKPDEPSYVRGARREPTPEERHKSEFRALDSAWNVSFKALQGIRPLTTSEPVTRRTELANALRGGPKPPKGNPRLVGAYNMPGYIPTVEAIKYAKQLPQQFEHFLKKTEPYDNMDPPRTVGTKAVDIEEAAREVIRQAQNNIFVPPHATKAEAAEIIGYGEKVMNGLHHWISATGELTDLEKALQKAMNAARFLQAKKD